MRIKLYMNCSNFLKRTVTLFSYIICFLLIVEFILRILVYFYPRRINLYKPQKQTFNIICLGDSFTYGWGVEPNHNYPAQLEKMLNDANLNILFRVFNLAVPGSNSSQHLKYLEDILNRYQKPDLIILLTGANDSWNFADSNIYKFINRDEGSLFDIINIKLRIFLSKFRTYKMLKIILLNLRKIPPESKIDPFRLIPRYEKININILKQLLEYNLTKIVELAKSSNTKIILQNYPRGDLYGDNITKKIALKFGVSFVDNFSVFNEKLKGMDYKDLFLYDNSHPNSTGYKIMSENIYKVIINDLFKK